MKRFFVATLAALVAIAGADAAWAEIKLSAIFGSHMVLQRDQANPVWGTAAAGEQITVAIGDQNHSATAADDGAWKVKLAPLPAGGPHKITIKGNNSSEVVLDDVLVGEVWICSGQSNMQWSVSQSFNGDLEALSAKNTNIRHISVPNVGTQEPKWTFNGAWTVCGPDNAGQLSAVGYFFGRRLQETLGVPVGLIDDAWGGSACEAWINRETLTKDGRFPELLARWEQTEKDFAGGKLDADYVVALEKWKKEAAAAKEAGKIPPREPQPPIRLMEGNSRPGNIYNGVLKSTIGYGIRGAIWYQGESNAGRAYQYRDLFPLMIQSWRQEWGQGDFPFYYVQLADFLDEKSAPGDSSWAELREAQTMTMSKLPNTGEAVIIDLGEANDIHPRNKQFVAERLARWALAKDYGVPNVAYRSPTYKAMETDGDKVNVKFDYVLSGLRAFDYKDVRGFAVAGEDKQWHWAKAEITGEYKDTVTVSSPEVKNPVAVRYGWADNPVCNLRDSQSALPVTPFRTDDWKGVTADAK
jgi:sialate O-acetylesterase